MVSFWRDSPSFPGLRVDHGRGARNQRQLEHDEHRELGVHHGVQEPGNAVELDDDIAVHAMGAATMPPSFTTTLPVAIRVDPFPQLRRSVG